MEWRTIDSAPRRGHILVGGPDWCTETENYDPATWLTPPTHWMPLPAPPGADQGIPVYASRDATDDVLGKDGE